MNKEDLMEKAIQLRPELNKTAAKAVVDGVFDAMFGALADGDDVTISGFGKFTVVETAARVGTNPSTGKKLEIAASKKVKFQAYKGLRAEVKAV